MRACVRASIYVCMCVCVTSFYIKKSEIIETGFYKIHIMQEE